jgi:hypothetical protein
MHLFRIIFVATTAVLVGSSHQALAAYCQASLFRHQELDAATVRRLERAWETATVADKTILEACLFEPGFTDILQAGEIRNLQFEMARITVTTGEKLPLPDTSERQILMYGHVAIAYGRHASGFPSKNSGLVPFADYFLWDGTSWHAFFSEQTALPPEPNW